MKNPALCLNLFSNTLLKQLLIKQENETTTKLTIFFPAVACKEALGSYVGGKTGWATETREERGSSSRVSLARPILSPSAYHAGYPRCDSLFMVLAITFHTAFFIASIRSTDRQTGHRLQVNEFY